MPTVEHITLQMLHTELKRQQRYFTDHYPQFVRKRKITPYERDHRRAVNAKLIELVENAIKTKGLTGQNFNNF